jgi:hypothetical protein
MKDKIQNLIKNVIEENAVRAKEQANKALYEKVGNRLKNEYINVSRRLFTGLNENASGLAQSEVSMMAAPPGGGPSQGNPSQGSGGREVAPEAPDPGPAPQKPIKKDGETASSFEKRLNQYYKDYEAWKKAKAAFDAYRKTRDRERPGGGQGEPRHGEKEKK